MLRARLNSIRVPFAAWMASAGLRFFLAALLFMPAPGLAQSADLQTLNQRVERLQRDLRTLEKDYYRGQKRGAGKSGAADRASSAPVSGQLANAEIRMSSLENEMRRLTGQLEEVRHGMQTMLQRMDGLVRDVDFRLTEIERRLGNAPQGAATSGPKTTSESGKGPQPGDATGAASDGAAPAETQTGEQQAAAPPSVLPKGTVIERYNYAYSLLLSVRLDEAEAAFREFLAKHGDDALAGNAQYWLGETYYTQNKLNDAAQTFLAGLQRFPDSAKAPDTMLKLGITLGKMGQREEACATFQEMRKLFTSLRPQVRKRLQNEMKTGNCG